MHETAAATTGSWEVAGPECGSVYGSNLAAAIFDGSHSGDEQRWVTIGKDEEGRYILLVHTFQEVEPNRASMRIISARRPTETEIAQYEGTYQ